MNVSTEIVEAVLRANEVSPEKLTQILNDIKERQALDKEPPAPRKKYEVVALVSDPEERLKGITLVGWVLKISEEHAFTKAPEFLIAAANDFNQSPKGRKVPVRTIGETCEAVPASILRNHDLQVLTKEPISFLTVKNYLPEDRPGEDID